MKFFAFVALIAVAASTASGAILPANADLQEIINAIYSPSTDPATAAALEALLLPHLNPIVGNPILIPEGPSPGPILGPGFEIINPDPVIIDTMPVVVPSPNPDAVVVPAPAPVEEAAPAASAPLVQLIVNINQAQAGPSPVAIVAPEVAPTPVQIVDSAPVYEPVHVGPAILPAPIQVVDVPAPSPVQIVDLPAPTPVQIVDLPAPTPVQIVDLPNPGAVNLPGILN